MYCKIVDGQITEYNRTRKQIGVGANSPESVCIAKGYLPIEDNQPAIDTATQRLGGNTYEILADKVVKHYIVVDIPLEEIMTAKAKEAERAVQAHINAKCVELGYDNENSIAKYLVAENPFYTECKAISLWIGAVWVKVNEIKNGTVAMPSSTEELIALLPEYVA